MLIRREPLLEQEPAWGVVTDASPGGVGGVLIHKVGSQWHIVEDFDAPLQPHQAAALEIEFNKPSGQAVLEWLVILRALSDLEHKASTGTSAHQVRQRICACYGKAVEVAHQDAQLPRGRTLPAA